MKRNTQMGECIYTTKLE